MTKRNPVTTYSPRIDPLAVLPVFFNLHGKKAMLVGATDGALWKAELLLASGAELHVYATAFSDAWQTLKNASPDHQLSLHERLWQVDDLQGHALAVADLEEEDVSLFQDAARKAGVPLNVIDKPDACAFQFGAIVNRSPLVIGISTDGAAPVFGQAVRARIETLLPRSLIQWAQAARAWRPLVQAKALPYALRRAFWEAFTAKAFAHPDHAPTVADRDSFLALVDTAAVSQKPQGRVSLVGAGPGDPDLLTLKAMRCLQSADVVLYDDLVSDAVLELARREAKRICVGKRGHLPSCPQAQINDLIVELALQGQHVVRLKSGDPAIFGRASEEIAQCRAHHIPVVMIPGISAAQAAASSLSVSLTERVQARRLQFITGHSHQGILPEDLDWSALSDPTVTTVIYMPRKTLSDWVLQALAHGLDPATPAVAMMSASLPQERHVAAPIATLPQAITDLDQTGPVLVLVGSVLRGCLSVSDRNSYALVA
jgi:uroporphyrin-III C-methyltransferase/precorrin-2 dehydrogenase/sirohydrochlorin ferrochelatase